MTINELRVLYRDQRLVEAIIEPQTKKGHTWWNFVIPKVASSPSPIFMVNNATTMI